MKKIDMKTKNRISDVLLIAIIILIILTWIKH